MHIRKLNQNYEPHKCQLIMFPTQSVWADWARFPLSNLLSAFLHSFLGMRRREGSSATPSSPQISGLRAKQRIGESKDFLLRSYILVNDYHGALLT